MLTLSQRRWETALKRLDNDRAQVLVSNTTDRLDLLNRVQQGAEEKREICKDKAWKYKTGDGSVIILRDVMDKALQCVHKVKEVGDVIVSYDPGHAALPWAAVRFLLAIAVENNEVFGAMAVGIEQVTRLLARYKVLEGLYLKPGLVDNIGLESSLIDLYVTVLTFQSRAIQYYTKSTTGKTWRGFEKLKLG